MLLYYQFKTLPLKSCFIMGKVGNDLKLELHSCVCVCIFNPSNAEAIIIQSTRIEEFLKTVWTLTCS